MGTHAIGGPEGGTGAEGEASSPAAPPRPARSGQWEGGPWATQTRRRAAVCSGFILTYKTSDTGGATLGVHRGAAAAQHPRRQGPERRRRRRGLPGGAQG